MSETFDPYHKWLGIPPDEQPPNHYSLLGVRDFESDPDVIEHATNRQIAHVRTFQIGQHSDHSQKLLNEISIAKVVLLNLEKKTGYDADLRKNLATQLASPAADEFVVTESQPSYRTVRQDRAARKNLVLVGGTGIVIVVIGIIAAAGLGNGESDEVAKQDRAAGIEKEVRTTPKQKKLPSPATTSKAGEGKSTESCEQIADGQNQIFKFDDTAVAEQFWEWSGEWKMVDDGGTADRGAQSFLRTRNAYKGNLTVDMDFSFGRAKFSNTGGCWITVWGKRLSITGGWRGQQLKVHIHREGDEIVYVKNGEEQRIPVELDVWSKPTIIEVRWRSRSSHFRRIQIKAQTAVPVNPRIE